MAQHCWLSAVQFARLQPLLPTDTRGVPRVADRRVISGTVPGWQSGWRWRDAPAVYGPAPRYHRFVRWARKGVWERVLTEVATADGPPLVLLLDTTHVKAHRAAVGGTGEHSSRRLAGRGAAGPPNFMPRSMGRGAPGDSCSARVSAGMHPLPPRLSRTCV